MLYSSVAVADMIPSTIDFFFILKKKKERKKGFCSCTVTHIAARLNPVLDGVKLINYSHNYKT